VRVVRLAGEARDRGRAHGEELRADIVNGLDRWRAHLAAAAGADVDAFLAELLAATRFDVAIQRWTPELAAEVAGIAEGAAADPAEIRAYQLMDEQWWFAEQRRGAPSGRAPVERCSSLAIHEPGQSPIVAQNMDLPTAYDGTQVLLHVVDERREHESFVFSAAGLIGFDGLNRDGVAVCCNSLPTLPVSPDGLPVAYVVRGVLTRRSLADAAAFLRATRHATGQNYVVGDGSGFLDLECWQDDAVGWSMSARCVLHTNHPLAVEGHIGEAPTGSTTHDRYGVLHARLAGDHEAAGVADVQALLSTAPVSVPRRADVPWMTVGSLVMELGTQPVLHLAPGPPASTPYTTFRFAQPAVK
jgi:hypothetical protein